MIESLQLDAVEAIDYARILINNLTIIVNEQWRRVSITIDLYYFITSVAQ